MNQTFNVVIDLHYRNIPMQLTANFESCNKDNFQMKNCDIFLSVALKQIVGTR